MLIIALEIKNPHLKSNLRAHTVELVCMWIARVRSVAAMHECVD